MMGGITDASPVVAVVPNYNMGENLRKLIPNLLEQGYDDVFVLDDASTDDSADVVRGFGSAVKLVRSPENRGASANRSQIIGHVADDVIIHFVDADMDLGTTDTPTVAREVFARYSGRGVGAIGGLVTRADGSQEPHNYGAVFSLWGGFTSGFPLMIDRLRDRPRLAATVQRTVAPVMKSWPNILEQPTATPAYWLHEGNMLISSTVFRSCGGYDPMIRSHEAQDLAIKLERMGIKRWFDPTICTVHQHIDVRGENRNKWANRAAWYLIRKYGVFRWLTDR